MALFSRHTFYDAVQRFYQQVGYCAHGIPCFQCCWPWQGLLTSSGYGKVYCLGQWYGAHRFSVELEHGALLFPSLYVMHCCDNPPCVNPNHLMVGTAGDNTRDAYRKGRMPSRKGQRLPRRADTMYTEQIAIHIRSRHPQQRFYGLRVLTSPFSVWNDLSL